ncbi:hypothetical protein [Hyalangium versicolor]|uniref:hypothetical protein n=1 Tax=Hyalangium versicolor TaxID=2861190 RepID=UPI001CCDED52|nr:hypothetical protein [Hyalangium versicolor]
MKSPLSPLRAVLTMATLMAAPHALAFDGSLNTTGKSTAVFVVTNFASATGFGAHISTSSSTDGYGGSDAECHFIESAGMIDLHCYDGYQDATNTQTDFYLPLGDKARLSTVTITVRASEVRVEALRLASAPASGSPKPYTVVGQFPLRTSSGFFRTTPIYYQTNGVLAAWAGRPGSGYQLFAAYTY